MKRYKFYLGKRLQYIVMADTSHDAILEMVNQHAGIAWNSYKEDGE